MFVQVTKSRRGNKVYRTYLVRESFRTPKGPRSRTVCNISHLPENIRNLITDALNGQRVANIDSLAIKNALDYGGLAVLVQTWKELDFDSLLASTGNARQRSLLQAMIFARLLFPSAKLALKNHAQGTLLAKACGLDEDESFDEHHLYDAMDTLNGHWCRMEKELYARSFDKTPPTVVLYDLTSSYFEGMGPKYWAKYGHSRDHRSDRPQIILAVATDARGVPIHVSLLRGNRADTTTLGGVLTILKRRFGIQEAVFVFDGGMSSKLNLANLERKELQFVTRLSNTTLESLIKQLPQEHQMELCDSDKVMDIMHEGKRYVIAGGPWRKERDEQRRNSRILKGEEKLKSLAAVVRKKVDPQKLASQAGRALARLKAHKYFSYHVDEKGVLQYARKQEVIDAETQRDGWYLLHTNLSSQECEGEGVLRHYKNLLEVEDAFREVKTYLKVRPFFHRRQDRVLNHVRICFLAFYMSAYLSNRWRLQGQNEEVVRILRQLQTIRLCNLVASNQELPAQFTQVPPNLNELIHSLDLLQLFATPPKWTNSQPL